METDCGGPSTTVQRNYNNPWEQDCLTPQRRTEDWKGSELLDDYGLCGRDWSPGHQTIFTYSWNPWDYNSQHLMSSDQPQNEFSLMDESRGDTCALLTILPSFQNQPTFTQASMVSWKLLTGDNGFTDGRNSGLFSTTWRRPYDSKTQMILVW